MARCRLSCLWLLWLVAAPALADRPNMVIILTDDMGYSDLGCYGSEIDTPNLNALAEGGLRFTQFYNTGRCCPTRASLLTGLYPHQAGMGHMTDNHNRPGYTGGLNRNCVTLGEALRPAGYNTYAVGKWHVTPAPTRGQFERGKIDRKNWPLQRGFDRYYGTIMGGGSFYDPATLTRDNELINPDDFNSYYYTDAIGDNAVRRIDSQPQDKPFVMYVAFTAAHWPMHAKPADIAKYRGRYDGGWDRLRDERYAKMRKLGLIDASAELSKHHSAWDETPDHPWFAERMETYAAMIDCMDQNVGRIVGALKKKGILDNTLVMYLQDNGGCQEEVSSNRKAYTMDTERPDAKPLGPDMLQFDLIPTFARDGRPVRMGHGVTPGPADTYMAYGIEWANASNTPFRMYKHFVHEGGISTPLIAHWPEGIKRRGELETQPGHLIDLMATCIDLADAQYPTSFHEGESIVPLEGVSLAPAFAGRSLERKQPIFWEHEGHRAIRDGDWKLVAKGKRGKWELYNLANDRSELHDLAGELPDKAGELAVQWRAWAKRANVLPMSPWVKK